MRWPEEYTIRIEHRWSLEDLHVFPRAYKFQNKEKIDFRDDYRK